MRNAHHRAVGGGGGAHAAKAGHYHLTHGDSIFLFLLENGGGARDAPIVDVCIWSTFTTAFTSNNLFYKHMQ